MKKKFLVVAVASLVFLLSGSGRADHEDWVKGLPPLHDALAHDDFATAKRLIQNGADVNAKSEDGDTPLHWAADANAHEIAVLLIERGADVNAKGNYISTPLHWAAHQYAYETAVLLIERGADVNPASTRGWMPLHTAASRTAHEIAVLLIERGADVNAKHEDGETPLHAAVSNRDRETAVLLIEKGADVNAKDEDGKTPLSYARDSRMIALFNDPKFHGYCHVEIKVQPDKIETGVDTVVAFSQMGEFDLDLEAVYLQKMRNIIKRKYKKIFVKRGAEACRFIMAGKPITKAYNKHFAALDLPHIYLINVDLL